MKSASSNQLMQSQTGELTYEKVDADNIQLALDIQRHVWLNLDVDKDYLAKPLDPEDENNVSWLVYHNRQLIGITGVFAFDPDEPGYDQGKSIWMDWFAVLPEFRRKGFGKQVLLDTINYCRNRGKFKYFRLDTVCYEGYPALFLYDKVMQLREGYDAEGVPNERCHYLVYSYSLDGSEIEPWDNHFLDLGYDAKNTRII